MKKDGNEEFRSEDYLIEGGLKGAKSRVEIFLAGGKKRRRKSIK